MRVLPKMIAAALLSFATQTVAAPYMGPIIDAHAHIRMGEKDTIALDHPKGTTVLRYLQKQAGISKSALIVIGFGSAADVRAKNDMVIAAAAADPDHFYAVASVNPDNGDAALDELDRLATLGVRMIKLHPNSQEFDVASPIIGRIAERAGARGLTLLFDSFDPFDAGQIGKFVKLVMGNPKTRFVLAHMAFNRFRETGTFALLRKMGAANNVWFDLSAIAPTYSGSPVAPELVWTMRKIGMDRMIFGSDWPVYSPQASLRAVRGLGLTAAELKLVLHDNIAALIAPKG